MLDLFWLVNDLVERLLGAIIGLITRVISPSQDEAAVMRRRRRSRRFGQALPIATLVLLIIFELLPFYWVIVTAFKTELQITRFENVGWPMPGR